MQSRKSPLNEYIPTSPTSPEEYLEFVGPDRVERLKQLAAPLEGKGWANVNSTLVGGGRRRDDQGDSAPGSGPGHRCPLACAGGQ